MRHSRGATRSERENPSARLLVATVSVFASLACGPITSGSAGTAPPGNLAFIDMNGRLAVVTTGGLDFKELTTVGTTANDPVLTPNGSAIAFAYNPDMTNAPTTGVYFVSFAGGTPTLVVDPGAGANVSSLCWDREAANLYFVSTAGGVSQIMKVPATANATAVLVPANGLAVQEIALINDTTLLVAADSDDLFTLDLTTGMATQITEVNSTGRPAVSPDGTRIAYIRTGTGLVVRTLQTGEETSIDPGGALSDNNPCFSPDGTYVSFDTGTAIYAIAATGAGGKIPLYTPGHEATWGS